MKLVLSWILLLGIWLVSYVPTNAMFEPPDLEWIPIERLLSTLQTRLDQPNLPVESRAMLEFQVGRLHSMSFAKQSEAIPIDKHAGAGTVVPFYGRGVNYLQFDVQDTNDVAQRATAKQHLAQAIMHLQNALTLDPNLRTARLGLAWCVDQNGNRQAALEGYRTVFKQCAIDNEEAFAVPSMGEETGRYLLALLDPATDAQEIADVKEKMGKWNTAARTVTPIIVPLQPGVHPKAMVQECAVRFDLDGSGPKVYQQWTAPKCGWLVFKNGGASPITSGLQLFGQNTFWIFWRDGYEALASLDANDDGIIAGDEKQGLAIWSDLNCDGICDPGEVRTLDQCGIESLSCQSESDSTGLLYSKNGVRFNDGSTADSCDWIIERAQ